MIHGEESHRGALHNAKSILRAHIPRLTLEPLEERILLSTIYFANSLDPLWIAQGQSADAPSDLGSADNITAGLEVRFTDPNSADPNDLGFVDFDPDTDAYIEITNSEFPDAWARCSPISRSATR